MKRFIEGDDRRQITFLSESLDDYIAEDNPIRAVDVFMGQLDLRALGFAIGPAMAGRPAYYPPLCSKSISTVI